MDPMAYCQQKAASSGSSFYYSFLFLPTAKRQAIMALYAFCQEVDNIADNCSDPIVASKKLNWWREEVSNIYKKKASHPVTSALSAVVPHYQLPQELFEEIISGMEMDLSITSYANFAELEKYCYKVAGAVGLLSTYILGYRHDSTLEFAKQLGTTLQLINIIRDVGEDARRMRIYLPQDECQQFQVPSKQLLQAHDSPQLKKLLKFQADRARSCYQSAMAQLTIDDRQQHTMSLIMAQIYLTSLDIIEQSGFAVLNQRISLTPIRKLWVAWRTWSREHKYLKMHQAI